MTDPADLTGRHFGDLVVLHRLPSRAPRRHRADRWLCQCICGTTPIVATAALVQGVVTGCGTCTHAATVQRECRRTVPEGGTTKICGRCGGLPQPLAAFPPHGTGRYGRGPHCRRCVAAKTADYRARKKVSP